MFSYLNKYIFVVVASTDVKELWKVFLKNIWKIPQNKQNIKNSKHLQKPHVFKNLQKSASSASSFES